MPIVVDSHGVGMGEHWPKIRVMATGDLSEMRITWIGVGPVDLGITSGGYSEQRLKLDRDSHDPIVVRLRP